MVTEDFPDDPPFLDRCQLPEPIVVSPQMWTHLYNTLKLYPNVNPFTFFDTSILELLMYCLFLVDTRYMYTWLIPLHIVFQGVDQGTLGSSFVRIAGRPFGGPLLSECRARSVRDLLVSIPYVGVKCLPNFTVGFCLLAPSLWRSDRVDLGCI